MNARHLMALAAAAVVAVVAAFYSTSLREPQSTGQGGAGMLLPGLKDTLNAVSEVRIITAGEQEAVSLVKGENQWTVEQKHGFAADTGKIRKLLLALADARLREAKTKNPENYHHLELQDISEPDAGGVQVVLAGVEAAPVIIGKTATDTGDATYARLAGASESWLVSGRIDVATTPLDWLNRDIIDLPASRIQSVTIRHPDGAVLRVARPDRATAEFAVEDVPDGRELSSPTAAAPIGSALQTLRLDDVMPASEAQMGEPTVTEYRLFDGIVVTVNSESGEDNKAIIALRATFDEALARQFAPPLEDLQNVEGDSAGLAAQDEAGTLPSFTAATEEAADLDARLSSWAFKIPTYKHQQMTRKMDALLKARQEDAE